MRRLLECPQTRRHLAGIAHVWSLDAQSNRSDDLGCARLVGETRMHRGVAAHQAARNRRLRVDAIWFVTRLASGRWRHGSAWCAIAALGTGQVAGVNIRTCAVVWSDLATGSCEEIVRSRKENELRSGEDEIALHGESRCIGGWRQQGAAHRATRSIGKEPQPLHRGAAGMLDSLCARAVPRTAPEPHEVEIEVAASGLNFMDLMAAMGLLPPEAMAGDSARNKLGLECAGRVVAVGDKVSRFAVGDEVIAAKLGNLASHVTVDERFVARKPPHLTFEQGATIPLAFLTAYYSLHTLGQMREGERVLIHSGTGGVGLAAVQLALKAALSCSRPPARLKTGPTRRARGAVRMDSQPRLRRRGVEAGPTVKASISSRTRPRRDRQEPLDLRPYGRFIEIGKTDIYKNRKIDAPCARTPVFADLVDPRPDSPARCWELVRASRTTRSVPCRTGRFRSHGSRTRSGMAQAKHIGKQIISIQIARDCRSSKGATVRRDRSRRQPSDH
jgi:hypothetical protein